LPATRSFPKTGYGLEDGGVGTWFVDEEFVAELTASGAEGAVVAESFTGAGGAGVADDGALGDSCCWAHPHHIKEASAQIETIRTFCDMSIIKLLSFTTG